MTAAAFRLITLLKLGEFNLSYTTAQSEPDHHRSYVDEGSAGSTALKIRVLLTMLIHAQILLADGAAAWCQWHRFGCCR